MPVAGPTALRTEFDVFPVVAPFFTPREGAPAGKANFLRQIGFPAHPRHRIGISTVPDRDRKDLAGYCNKTTL
jgi:hypothetical protein